MTDTEDAINALVAERSGDVVNDLVTAAKAALEIRATNSKRGGLVIAALREHGLSWNQIHERTGIKPTTARRWAEPPQSDDD